jgi:hypothetical protein
MLLDQACRTDPELRREVEALLASEENARDHLHAAVREQPQTVGFPLAGETISHYRILDGLAGGGMESRATGTVPPSRERQRENLC